MNVMNLFASIKKYLLILTCIILFSDMSSSASFCSKYFLALWLVSCLPSSFRPGTIKICIYNEEEAITFAAVLVFSAIWEKSKEKLNNSSTKNVGIEWYAILTHENYNYILKLNNLLISMKLNTYYDTIYIMKT